jgi:hypothetical protein
MKIKKGFVLRTVGDETVIVGEGLEQINFNKIICLNESAVFLWKKCIDRDFDAELMADMLTENYEVERADALKDANDLIDRFKSAGLLEE